jgi:hypothetical protein
MSFEKAIDNTDLVQQQSAEKIPRNTLYLIAMQFVD